jgi:hypothetical protein
MTLSLRTRTEVRLREAGPLFNYRSQKLASKSSHKDGFRFG